MRLRLDTHIFLWYITANPRLPASFAVAIRDPANEAFLSAASVWELVIKQGLGKLLLPAAPDDYLPRQRDAHGIHALPIDEEAMRYVAGLPVLHRDPFDRMLIAQALQHGLTIVTVDHEILAYPVSVLPKI